MNVLGKIYRDGLCGIPVDGAKAIEWFEKSARKNDVFAIVRLGEIYRDGLCGIHVESQKALSLFMSVAKPDGESKRGNVMALYALGALYLRGSGDIAPDAEAAKHWFELALKHNAAHGNDVLTEKELIIINDALTHSKPEQTTEPKQAIEPKQCEEDSDDTAKPRKTNRAALWILDALIIIAAAIFALNYLDIIDLNHIINSISEWLRSIM